MRGSEELRNCENQKSVFRFSEVEQPVHLGCRIDLLTKELLSEALVLDFVPVGTAFFFCFLLSFF